MHEVFLQRLAAHPAFRNNINFHVFLEYEGDVRASHDAFDYISTTLLYEYSLAAECEDEEQEGKAHRLH